MISDEFKYYVASTLDDPPRFLLWDFDVAMIFIVMLGIGILAGWLITGGALGIGASWLYNRSKSGKTRGYGIHLLYWFMPALVSTKRIPKSNIRHFIG
jgi:conjugal transfer pilus assembly protein TraL